MRFGPDGESLGPAQAYAALERFAHRYGRAPVLLLIHAAVPQGFRPDLLNLIKLNFLLEACDDLTVDADVLFSPLVESLGAGYFRLDEEVRRQCLILLDAVYREEGERRSIAVARFLLAFVNRLSRSAEAAEDPLLQDYLGVQGWVAGAFLEPAATAGHFAQALRTSAAGNADAGARLQMSSLASALSVSLTGYPELIAYAQGLGALARGDEASARRFFRPFINDEMKIGDITLPRPAEVLDQQIVETPSRTEPPPREPPQPRTVTIKIQIYVSYALNDDELPHYLIGGKGFVTTLIDRLEHEVTRRGAPTLSFWRDMTRLVPKESIDESVRSAIKDSALFLVILSPNWMNNKWCLRELEIFADRRLLLKDELGVRQRIIVVSKSFVDPARRPSLLRGQKSFDFFAFDPVTSGLQVDYFARGEIRDERYYALMQQLGQYVWMQAQEVQNRETQPRSTVENLPRFPSEQIVYVAKPAADMREAYDRLVNELQHRGYAVVPDPLTDIPRDASAVAFVDHALASASFSIHLLGESAGYTPETLEPIVKLQLVRAGSMASGARTSFHRIIWAPRVLDRRADAVPFARTRHDPLSVLARFDQLLSTDVVSAESLSSFVVYVVDLVTRPAVRAASQAPELHGSVYLCCRDWNSFAVELSRALQGIGVEVLMPVQGGTPSDLRRFHRQNLIACDSIIVCWTDESEVWMRATLSELANWRRLDRKRPFAVRALAIGPPPNERKNLLIHLPPGREIDITLNFMSVQPIAKSLEEILSRTFGVPQPPATA
jgi:hypothetical protein